MNTARCVPRETALLILTIESLQVVRQRILSIASSFCAQPQPLLTLQVHSHTTSEPGLHVCHFLVKPRFACTIHCNIDSNALLETAVIHRRCRRPKPLSLSIQVGRGGGYGQPFTLL